jgi:tetratricopeptide (TPR) repeat protein
MSDFLNRLRAALATRYEIRSEIGSGGMATVYLAEDLKHHRKVALKVLRQEVAAVFGADRFLREIAILARLQHPNILGLFDSGDADGLLYYVMPFVEGESLRDRLDREGQLPLDDALKIVHQVNEGLSYAHSVGIVHRDIKPENIMLTGEHVLLADFGIARAVSLAGADRLTKTGIVVGTPAYMSPEQASGNQAIDGRSDLYSLACVLYEMLGGEPPHTGPTPQAILARQLTGEVRSLTPLRSTVSPELDAVIRVALAPAPADRHATPYEFSTALNSAPVTATTPGRKLHPVTARRRLRRWVVAAVAAATIAVLAVVGIHQFSGSSVPDDGRLGLAVFPFRASSMEADRWSEQLPDLLATALDGTPGVRVADPWSLWRSLRSDRAARALSPSDAGEAERLARAARAGQFILGSLAVEAGTLNLTLRVYRTGLTDPLHSLAHVGSVDSIAALVQRLAVEIITKVWPRDSVPTVPRLDRYTTRSADALKAYLHAKEAMRRGQVDEAEAAIDTALALDSTFALALVDAISIKSWAQYMKGEPYYLTDLAQRANEYADSLSERNRLRVRGALASVRTDGSAAVAAASRILEIDSTDFDAWNSLTYYHATYGWQYGADERDALRASDRALELDASYVPALAARINIALASASPEELEPLLDKMRRVDTLTVLARSTLLGVQGLAVDSSAFIEFADRAAAASQQEWLAVLRQLRSYHPERAEILLQKRLEAANPGSPVATAQAEQGRLLIAEGSVRRVDSMLQMGAYPDSGVALALRAQLITATLAGVGDEGIASRTVAALESLSPDSALEYFYRRPVWWIGWLVGAYHATFGDTAVTRQWQAALGTLPAGGTSQDYRGALQSDMEARIAARRGDLDTALVLAQRAYALWSIHSNNSAESQPEASMRFHLGMLLRATNRPDSAAAILRSLVPPTTWMGFRTARASFELGQLAENRMDFEAAARHYGRALSLWERGDPEIREWRTQAREGLQRVVGERGR